MNSRVRFVNTLTSVVLLLTLTSCSDSSTSMDDAMELPGAPTGSVSSEVTTEHENAAAHAIIGCSASYFPSSEAYEGLPANVRDGYLLTIALENGAISQEEYLSYQAFVEQYEAVNEAFLQAKILDDTWSELAYAWESSLAEVSDAYANGISMRDATYSVSQSSSSAIDASCELAFSAGADYATQAGLIFQEWLRIYFE